MHMIIARDADSFREMYASLAMGLLHAESFDRGEVHAQKTTTPEMVSKELCDQVLQFDLYRKSLETWQEMVTPNLPWAEDHFLERVSGEPMNPPPSNEWWPYAQNSNEVHKKGEVFSHTYPERFWPKYAGDPEDQSWAIASPTGRINFGLRFVYGDLNNLVSILMKNPHSRQAYLPVWFPEDLAAADMGERVPCTLGYHFLMQSDGYLHMSYYMRSCDLVRFFKDDVYMAGRLLQWVAHETGERPGSVKIYIANLHAFVGDDAFLREKAHEKPSVTHDIRANYNFGAL